MRRVSRIGISFPKAANSGKKRFPVLWQQKMQFPPPKKTHWNLDWQISLFQPL